MKLDTLRLKLTIGDALVDVERFSHGVVAQGVFRSISVEEKREAERVFRATERAARLACRRVS